MEGRIAVVVGEVEARHGSQRILRAKAAISGYSGDRDRGATGREDGESGVLLKGGSFDGG